MIKIIILFMVMISILTGCASAPTARDLQRKAVLDCIKDLKNSGDSSTMDSFEVCRQVYAMRKVD